MAVSGKTTTTTNPSSTLHPPYLQMISEAISSLKDRTGSSQPAIAKFMEEKYSSLLPPNFKKMLSIQLKRFVKSEKLVKIKNSYKVSASENVKLVAAAAASIKESEKKKTDKAVVKKNGEKTKRLSQVKTPEALKKKKKVSTLRRGTHPSRSRLGLDDDDDVQW